MVVLPLIALVAPWFAGRGPVAGARIEPALTALALAAVQVMVGPPH